MPYAHVGIHGRTTLACVVVVCLSITTSTTFAQQPPGQDSAAMRLFAASADISALVARAQTKRESINRIRSTGPTTATLHAQPRVPSGRAERHGLGA